MKGENRRWYCLQCRPKREHITSAALRQRADTEVLYPRIRQIRGKGGRVVTSTDAMFPGYLFARFDLMQTAPDLPQIPGFLAVVEYRDRCAEINGLVIGALKAWLDPLGIFDMTVQHVSERTFSDGPLHGLERVLTGTCPPRERLNEFLRFLPGVVVPGVVFPTTRTLRV